MCRSEPWVAKIEGIVYIVCDAITEGLFATRGSLLRGLKPVIQQKATFGSLFLWVFCLGCEQVWIVMCRSEPWVAKIEGIVYIVCDVITEGLFATRGSLLRDSPKACSRPEVRSYGIHQRPVRDPRFAPTGFTKRLFAT